MTLDWLTTYVVAAIFVATIVRSAFGFGEALIAVPLLAIAMPVGIAAPVAVLVSITVAAIVVAQDWRHVHVRGASRLIVSTLFGIPLGLLLLTKAPDPIVKALLGASVAAFAVYSLLRRASGELKDDRLAWIFGFMAGILGGAYGMNGPPLVVYGSLRRWAPGQFRATLQAYFLPASVLGMAGYASAGLWTRDVTRYYVISLPAIVVAIVLGRAVNRRLSAGRFLIVVNVALAVLGIALLLQALVSRAARAAGAL
jgi:uncharacterized protein